MTDFSIYPSHLDGYSTLPLRRDGIHEIRADDYNRLRDAIIKIEYELGLQPSGAYSTVRGRLDSIGDSSALIEAHIAETTGAHAASAISILDSANNYISSNVEDALAELASVLAATPDRIGYNSDNIPNSGYPSFVSSGGTLHVYNTSAGSTVLDTTQPVSITGIRIIEVGDANGSGTGAQLAFTTSPESLVWKAPGDVLGTAVDISGLSEGETALLSSDDTTKKIRISRTSANLPVGAVSENFDLLKLDNKSGTYSLSGTGFVSTSYATRTASSATATSRDQFMIGGIIYPADKGTLVLQRKLRQDSEFVPIATLDLSTNFDESLRTDGQLVYNPTMSSYDIITLFDRLPGRNDYETLSEGSNGQIYENFNISNIFTAFQLARYLIPASNPNIASEGTLEAPASFLASEINSKVSAYRVVHYQPGVTNFNGEPAASDIYSKSDTYGSSNNGDDTVRMSNVFLDSNTTRPGVASATLKLVSADETTTKVISGIHYYNSSSDVFDLEVQSDTNLFKNIYSRSDILNLQSDALFFANGADGYDYPLDHLFDASNNLYSSSNLPAVGDAGYLYFNASYNTLGRLYPRTEAFSTDAFITTKFKDPFGYGTAVDAYGVDLSDVATRILVNSFSSSRSTDTQEYFTDETYRVGTDETFAFDLDVDQFTNAYGAGTNGTLAAFHSHLPLSGSELQCGGKFTTDIEIGGLIYPQSDYTSAVSPTQGLANYDGYIGDRYYQRLFNVGNAINGAKLRIKSDGTYPLEYDDIVKSYTQRPVKIEVKIPGPEGTGWMDLGALFETGQISDGDGALGGSITGTIGDFTVPFTFGVKNNAATNNFVAVRITYLNAAITNAKTRVITYVEMTQ